MCSNQPPNGFPSKFVRLSGGAEFTDLFLVCVCEVRDVKRHGHTLPLFLTSIKNWGPGKRKVGVWFSLHPHTLN